MKVEILKSKVENDSKASGALRLVFYFLLSTLAFSSAFSQGVSNPGVPNKILGPNGATVDASSGNIGITAGSGGAVNVTNGDTYVPTIIDFSTSLTPVLSANGHAAMSYDGTNLKLSVNGGAYTAIGGATWSSIGAGTGAVNITAGGTNQNITLTPSGTGVVTAGNFRVNAGVGAFSNSGTSWGVLVNFTNQQIEMAGSGGMKWAAIGQTAGSTASSGIFQNAAGIIEFNSGTAGAYRDWISRYGTIGGSSGTQIKLIKNTPAPKTIPATASGAVDSSQTITMTGAVVGDRVEATGDATFWSGANMVRGESTLSAQVTAADTVTLYFRCGNALACTPGASATIKATLMQF